MAPWGRAVALRQGGRDSSEHLKDSGRYRPHAAPQVWPWPRPRCSCRLAPTRAHEFSRPGGRTRRSSTGGHPLGICTPGARPPQAQAPDPDDFSSRYRREATHAPHSRRRRVDRAGVAGGRRLGARWCLPPALLLQARSRRVGRNDDGRHTNGVAPVRDRGERRLHIAMWLCISQMSTSAPAGPAVALSAPPSVMRAASPALSGPAASTSRSPAAT